MVINRNGLRRRVAPAAVGLHETLYTRWMRRSDKGVFAPVPVGLTAGHCKQKIVMTHATYLNVPPTPTRLDIKKGGVVA